MLKKIAVAMVAVGGLMIASVPAHAAGHISLSLGLPLPGVYVAPAPAYAPAYAPSYYGPPVVYSAPPVVYESPAPYGYYYGGPRYYAPRVVYRGGPRYYEGFRGGWHR